MTLGTRAELIARLQQEGNPDEELVWTYWGEEDFKNYKDKGQAYGLVEDALDNAIADVNQYLSANYEEGEIEL